MNKTFKPCNRLNRLYVEPPASSAPKSQSFRDFGGVVISSNGAHINIEMCG